MTNTTTWVNIITGGNTVIQEKTIIHGKREVTNLKSESCEVETCDGMGWDRLAGTGVATAQKIVINGDQKLIVNLTQFEATFGHNTTHWQWNIMTLLLRIQM